MRTQNWVVEGKVNFEKVRENLGFKNFKNIVYKILRVNKIF